MTKEYCNPCDFCKHCILFCNYNSYESPHTPRRGMPCTYFTPRLHSEGLLREMKLKEIIQMAQDIRNWGFKVTYTNGEFIYSKETIKRGSE